jgi:superfamily II DNA or RNA helicase
MNLRDYQQRAVASALETLRSSGSTLLVMPTGCGKTVVFAHIIQSIQTGRVLVLAHREELVYQAAATIQRVTGVYPAIEMAGQRADLDMFRSGRVIVSTIQTQIAGTDGRRRMHRFRPSDFGLVIVDEAHHAPSKSYRKVLSHYLQNPECRVLGVTATPDRHDQAALGQVFDSAAFEYGISEAIPDGWLVPIRSQSIRIRGLDYSHIHVSTRGDLNGAELAAVLEDERTAQEVARPIVAEAGARKTLVFAVRVKHAEQLAEIINRIKPGSARWISGKTPREERAQTLADYAASKFQFLVNVAVFTEGFDEPSIELIAMARPTMSRALFAQMIGRGTRPLPGLVDGLGSPAERILAIAKSRKPHLEVLDFEGNCGRHKLITAADVLGGDYDTEVVELANRRSRERADTGQPVDVMETLEKAKAENEAEKVRQRHLRQDLVPEVSYDKKTIDLFNILDIDPPRQNGWDLSNPPTQRMINYLARSGVPNPETLSRAVAGRLCGEINARREKGRATFKQARLLQRHGYPTNCSFAEASVIIGVLKANGWRRPDPAPSGVAG